MMPEDVNLEESFRKNWAKALTLYTFSSLSSEVFDALASDTKMRGNEHILDEVSDIALSAEAFLNRSILPQVGILQGDSDGVVPDNNFLKLKHLVPQAQFFEIEKCGHFPMVD